MRNVTALTVVKSPRKVSDFMVPARVARGSFAVQTANGKTVVYPQSDIVKASKALAKMKVPFRVFTGSSFDPALEGLIGVGVQSHQQATENRKRQREGE